MLSFVDRLTRATVGVAMLSVTACYNDPSPSEPPVTATLDQELRAAMSNWGAQLPIAQIPQQNPALVALGRALFFDKELSGNRDISCGTCHDPVTHGTDGLSLAIGTGGRGSGDARVLGAGRHFVPRNAPSMLNQALTFPYMFWDGRLVDRNLVSQPDSVIRILFPAGLSSALATQVMLPVLNRTEMRGARGDKDHLGNANELAEINDSEPNKVWDALMVRLLRISGYQGLFAAAYPGIPANLLGFQHAANAIAAFEIDAFTRTDSPFDRFLKHNGSAMSEEAKRGGLLFFGVARCASCHNGPALGGQQFANIGIVQIGPGVGKFAPLDVGRDEHMQFPGVPQPSPFRFSFRAAPLRNVELTAPYMHNGAYPTLEAVVRHYNNADSAVRSYDVTQLDPRFRSSYHGDVATVTNVAQSLDFRVRQPLRLTLQQQQQLVAFLKSLTDPAARDMRAITPAQVPSGLPVH